MAESHKEYLRRALLLSLIRLHKRALHPCHPLSIASGKSPVNLQNKSLLCVYFSFLFHFFLETSIYYLGNEPPNKEQTVLWQKRWHILPWTSQKHCHWSYPCHHLTPQVVFNKAVFSWGIRFSSRERVREDGVLCIPPRVSELNLSAAHSCLAHRGLLRDRGLPVCHFNPVAFRTSQLSICWREQACRQSGNQGLWRV